MVWLTKGCLRLSDKNMVSGSPRVAQNWQYAPKIVLAALGGMVGCCTGDSTRSKAECACDEEPMGRKGM